MVVLVRGALVRTGRGSAGRSESFLTEFPLERGERDRIMGLWTQRVRLG